MKKRFGVALIVFFTLGVISGVGYVLKLWTIANTLVNWLGVLAALILLVFVPSIYKFLFKFTFSKKEQKQANEKA